MEIYIIHCVALVVMIIYCLRLNAANLSTNESMNEFESTYNVDNSGILASLPYSDKLIVRLFFGSQYNELFFKLINLQNVLPWSFANYGCLTNIWRAYSAEIHHMTVAVFMFHRPCKGIVGAESLM
jgi:hypothetical protein